MKIEYLLIKPNNDFCSNADQFKSLLLSNKRIRMNESEMQFSGISLAYTLSSQEVEWKKTKEIVFYFTVSTEEDNVKMLEDFDQLLRRINENCGNQFKINTIWDDVSIHYTTKLYPELVETENLLRKLIYRFMIKTAGSSWFSNVVPDSVIDAIKKTAEKNRLDDLPEVDQLYLTDFIQLGWFFFEKYTTKPLNQNAVQELRRIAEETDDVRQKFTSFLETYEAKSNWERYFAEKIEVDGLYDKWQQLYGYRNRVAHAKRLSGKDYDTAQELINELKTAFEKCLEHIDDVEMTEEEAEAVQEVAKETISLPKPKSSDSWKLDYPGAISGLSSLGMAAARITPQVSLDGLSTGVLQFADQQQRLMDQVHLASGSLLFSDTLASQLQVAADTGSLLIKATEPYQQSLDALRIATEPLTTKPSYLGNLDLGGLGNIRASDLGLSLGSVSKPEEKHTQEKHDKRKETSVEKDHKSEGDPLQ